MPELSGAALYRRAKQLIPGGTQLLSKRPELFAPEVWPAYYQSAQGCEITDLDGRHFVDMTTAGIGTCLLGYNDPEVTEAVLDCVRRGAMTSLNPALEVTLAEMLIEMHPWADQARFCRTGGETMAVAVRLARAATGRDRVAFSGYHGWHDWYLAANLAEETLGDHLLPGLPPAGVPAGLLGTALPFRYNQIHELDAIISQHGSELAAVVIEPVRGQLPAPGFLERIRQACNEIGAVMIVDEITIGWRLCLGGSHLGFGIEPDVAVFAKTISNGYAMGAVIGRRSVMDAAQTSFISSAYWTEAIGPTAAVATINRLKQQDVPEHVRQIGQQMIDGWNLLTAKHDLTAADGGIPALAHLTLDHPDAPALDTLFTVRMLDRGFLACPRFYPTLAHQSSHVEEFLDAAAQVFPELAAAAHDGTAAQRLGTPIRQQGFQRLT